MEMNGIAARSFLNNLHTAEGIEGFNKFADKIGVPGNTVYGWWRRGNVPSWRLDAFAKGYERAIADGLFVSVVGVSPPQKKRARS